VKNESGEFYMLLSVSMDRFHFWSFTLLIFPLFFHTIGFCCNALAHKHGQHMHPCKNMYTFQERLQSLHLTNV
jgi:hypothetical protein